MKAHDYPTLETKEDLIKWIKAEHTGLCGDFAYSVYLHDNWKTIAPVCYLSTITNNAIDLMGLDIPKGNNEGNREWSALKSVVYETNSKDDDKIKHEQEIKHSEAMIQNGFTALTLEALEQFAGKKIVIELLHQHDWLGDEWKQHTLKVLKCHDGTFYLTEPRARTRGLLATNYIGKFARLA